MARLKRETQALHEATEARMPVMDPALDRAAYARLLAQLYALVAPLETRLLALPLPASLALDERLKQGALRRDLAALGAAVPAGRADWLPGDVAEGLGTLYVLEGATLGGQIIARHLGPRLGLDAASGLAYFSAYGPQTGPMWRRFAEAMTREVPPEAGAAVVQGACAAFLAFGRALHTPPV
ncbi:biliverdin-producing heme oxygenase [Deinococcus petrolearius]|uniref:Biliverdin-producing heme oxygenase n=1 Tax=Deinococcus petrolearius TaxID=1751295 RepID=A0ABW1DH22_9DEIO